MFNEQKNEWAQGTVIGIRGMHTTIENNPCSRASPILYKKGKYLCNKLNDDKTGTQRSTAIRGYRKSPE